MQAAVTTSDSGNPRSKSMAVRSGLGQPLSIRRSASATQTGLITHHIDANIDADRDKLMNDLTAAGWLSSTEGIEGFQPKHDGRNGGGDPYHTDGKLSLGILKGR